MSASDTEQPQQIQHTLSARGRSNVQLNDQEGLSTVRNDDNVHTTILNFLIKHLKRRSLFLATNHARVEWLLKRFSGAVANLCQGQPFALFIWGVVQPLLVSISPPLPQAPTTLPYSRNT